MYCMPSIVHSKFVFLNKHAIVFVMAKHMQEEQDSDDDQRWPPACKAWIIAQTTTSACAARGPSALLLDPVAELQLASDLEQQLVFPAEVMATTLRSDIVIWSL